METVKIFKAKKISSGKASGPALITRERLGLRGMGELEGASLAGAVLIFPSSKGSTLWSITLDHLCRFGNAPAAMINSKLDPFVTLGCILQDIPLVQIEDESFFEQVKNGDLVTVDADRGEISIIHTG